MMQTHQIETQTLIILVILFLAYVIGDLTTTMWLVKNYPGGIEGESNPWAVFIFSSAGISGMIFAKISVFMILSASVIMMEYLYKHEKRIMSIMHYTVIGLTGWSLIIITINVMLMYLLSLQGGMSEVDSLPKIYAILFGLVFTSLIILPKFYPKDLKKIQVILSIFTVFLPMAFVPRIYENMFLQDVFITVAYFGAVIGMISMMILVMNKLYNPKIIVP